MISSTSRSFKSKAPNNRSRSSFSKFPSEWLKAIAPAISFCAASSSSRPVIFAPNSLRIARTVILTVATMGANIITRALIGAETKLAAPSELEIA